MGIDKTLATPTRRRFSPGFAEGEDWGEGAFASVDQKLENALIRKASGESHGIFLAGLPRSRNDILRGLPMVHVVPFPRCSKQRDVLWITGDTEFLAALLPLRDAMVTQPVSTAPLPFNTRGRAGA
mgnify:CR=1 FL=1